VNFKIYKKYINKNGVKSIQNNNKFYEFTPFSFTRIILIAKYDKSENTPM